MKLVRVISATRTVSYIGFWTDYSIPDWGSKCGKRLRSVVGFTRCIEQIP